MAMMRSDLHLTLADGTEIGYAEVGEPDDSRQVRSAL
jgi:hypothetical protein